MEAMLINNGPTGVQIREMFDSLAPKYDVFNRVTSLGLDRGWRNKALKPIKEGMRVLDLGCGTGDLALDAAKAAITCACFPHSKEGRCFLIVAF